MYNKNIQYVQITKAQQPSFWYSKRIGDIFLVNASLKAPPFFVGKLIVVTATNVEEGNGKFIQSEDCEILKCRWKR